MILTAPTKSASRIGAFAILTVASAPAVVVALVAAAFLMRAVGGEGALQGGPWREMLLGILPVGPALVLALGARWHVTRPGVVPVALLFALGSALITTGYFLGASPIVGGDGATGAVATSPVAPVPWLATDTPRLAACIAPLVMGLLVSFRRRAVPTHVMAGAAVGSAMIALLLAAARGGAPPPSRYLSALQPSVEIVDYRSFRLGRSDYRIERVEPPPLDDRWSRAHGLEGKSGCVLRGPGEPLALGNLLYEESGCSLGWDSTVTSERQNIRSAVYVDPRGDLAVLYQPQATGPYLVSAFAPLDQRSAPRLCDGCSTYALALRTRDGARITLDIKLLGDRLSAPRSMLGAGVLGAVAALSLFIAAWRVRRRVRSEVGRDAMHEGGGAVRIDDTVVHVAAAYFAHCDHTNRRIAITRFAAWRSERSDVLSWGFLAVVGSSGLVSGGG